MHPIEQCEKVVIPQGALYLGPSDTKYSVGYLELQPHTSLTLHNRPAIERLTQVKGKSVMVIFDTTQGKTVLLDTGNSVIMKPNTWHIHSNPFSEISLTYWDFAGDVTEIIQTIRRQAK